MFKWVDTQLAKLKAASREQRIRLAFPEYEASRRAEHVRISLRKFPTGALEQELHKKLAEVREQVRIKYSGPVSALENEIALLQREIGSINAELSILQHPYKAELEPLYEALAGLGAEVKAAQVAKQDAYAHLERASKKVSDWHDKSKRSPFLFGNGGTTLPKHSLFGQSFGDLEGYKFERSCAAREIKRYKDQVAELNLRRDEIYRKISVIKAARQRMFELKQQGRSVSSLQSKLTRQQAALSTLSLRLSSLRSERAKVLDTARYQTGAMEIERLILALKLKRDDFVQSFDAPDAAAARYAAHVEDWINAHGS